MSRISGQSRRPFSKCWDFLDMSRQAFWNVDIESLDQDHVETNRDAPAYLFTRHFGGNFLEKWGWIMRH
jgi:hypothetical protein